MSDKAENICLAVVLALLAAALGAWGIYKFQHRQDSEGAQNYYYKLTGFCESYPDVVVDITFERALTPEQKLEICSAVADKMFENIEEDDHYLHYMDSMNTETTDKLITLYIDFGCNEGEGLEVFLAYFNSEIEGIKRVTLS